MLSHSQTPRTARFRDDLVISPAFGSGESARSYLVEDPVAHESFSFGEEEYFLCCSMDGSATAEEILDQFQKRFGAEMSLEHFQGFEKHLLSTGLARPAALGAICEEDDDTDLVPESAEGFGKFFQRHRTLAILLVLGALMFVPFAYRPGGEIQVLPPLQQQIQAPVTGRIAEVHFDGGDGKLIPKGTLVARMISSEIENELLTLEQSRSQQLATIDKLKSELAKVQSGARNEEITAAEAKLQQAVEQMSVAVQELQSAKVSSEYSMMVLPRMKKLYKSGSLALLQYEEAKKTAEIDRINVEKASKNLASLTKSRDEAQAQLDLLKSGSRPEDIDAARHSVEAAQAELSRVEQQIVYAKQQQTEAALLMPFEGYLVDSHLDFKKGTYLKQSEMYAVAQNNSQPLVEAQLPEYDTEGVEVGATAQVKLYAYPNSSLKGKVLSIQPAALPASSGSTTSQESITKLFRVLIEVEKPPFTLKAGMTGYAKINAGYQPLGLLLARPIIRFIQIEMWSWLP